METSLPEGLRIHHVGSTSIPHMPGKDIIDIDIECPGGSMKRLIPRLTEAGYIHEGDRGITTREVFQPRDDTAAAPLWPHHLYACEADSPELRRHLAFRDYLISHPKRAQWLAAQKVRADEQSKSREEYIEGKAASYKQIVSEAMIWIENP